MIKAQFGMALLIAVFFLAVSVLPLFSTVGATSLNGFQSAVLSADQNSQTSLNSTNLALNLTASDILQISSQLGSNLTINSIAGSGVYSTNYVRTAQTNQFNFAAVNGSGYSIQLTSVASNATHNFMAVRIVDSVTRNSTLLDNVTGVGSVSMNITILSIVARSGNSSIWDPLFGVTGLKTPNFSISLSETIVVLALASAAFLGIGYYFRSKAIYLGVMFAAITLIALIGFLFVSVALGIYVAGYLGVGLYARYRRKR